MSFWTKFACAPSFLRRGEEHSYSSVPLRETSSSIFIPDDVERMIFELAAKDDHKTALRLVRVARHVKLWIDPLLYSVVVLDTEKKSEAFLKTIATSGRPYEFYARHVKTVYFRWVKDTIGRQIIATCPGVQMLSCDSLSDFPQLSQGPLHPTRLSADLCRLLNAPDPDFGLPLFADVTHLQHVGRLREWAKWTWRGVDRLPLTHVCLRIFPYEDRAIVKASLDNFLAKAPSSLKTCVVLVSGEVSTLHEIAVGNCDRRVVIGDVWEMEPDSPYKGLVVHRPSPGNLKDWGHLPSWEMGMWDQADVIVDKREAKSQNACVNGVVGEPTKKLSE